MPRSLSCFIKAFLFILISVTAGTPALSETRIASWNIQNLGWNNGKDYQALGEVGRFFDLISVQEVMNQEGIDRFQAALAQRTQADWEQMCSHLIGRGSYREMYCFVWRPDRITWVGGAAVYLDDADLFAREPFSSIFRTRDGFEFVATSVHSIYGNSVAVRQAEAIALRDYHDWLRETFENRPVFLMGDFNLAPTNPAWAPMGEVAYPLIQDGATTISTIDGRFANLYDNIWVDVDRDLPIADFGRLEFPHQVLGITHGEARDRVSDHIPVWVTLSPDAVARFAKNDFAGAQTALREGLQGIRDTMQEKEPETLPPIIGNRNSMIYHLPHCPSYTRVGASNRMAFTSEDDAVAAGYRRARNCN